MKLKKQENYLAVLVNLYISFFGYRQILTEYTCTTDLYRISMWIYKMLDICTTPPKKCHLVHTNTRHNPKSPFPEVVSKSL